MDHLISHTDSESDTESYGEQEEYVLGYHGENYYNYDILERQFKRHWTLAKLLGLTNANSELIAPEDDYNSDYIDGLQDVGHGEDSDVPEIKSNPILYTFKVVCCLLDPITQPSELDNVIYSIDLLSDLCLSLAYDTIDVDDPIPLHTLSSRILIILDSILRYLNCHDEAALKNIDNDEQNWHKTYKLWNPPFHMKNFNDIRLLYSICCTLLFALHKINNQNKNLAMNPLLKFFLKLWKSATHIVLYGLEIDRRDENNGSPGYPNIIKETIKGTSSIRVVLSSILNDNYGEFFHDFKHESLSNFMNPLKRKQSNGSLYIDIRWHIAALLATGIDLNEVTEILNDLEPNDRFDEDVKYMFDIDYETLSNNSNSSIISDEYAVECGCKFDNNEYSDFETAVRSENTIDFDNNGQDWRDIPRGTNNLFNKNMPLSHENTFDWHELKDILQTMSEGPIDNLVGQEVINSIAFGVKLEYEEQIQLAELPHDERLKKEEEFSQNRDESIITPDKIYQRFSYDYLFPSIMRYNPTIAASMMDEMFMAHGYRRVLIWFMTHLDLSQSLINYVHELLTGGRGGSTITSFTFSRTGPLVLSDVERNMLLHEFLSNSSIYINKIISDKFHNQDLLKNLMRLICLMIQSLFDKGILKSNDEYKNDLQNLLVNWVGILKEARELYFGVITDSTVDITTVEKQVVPIVKELPVEEKDLFASAEDEEEYKSTKQSQKEFLTSQEEYVSMKQQLFDDLLSTILNRTQYSSANRIKFQQFLKAFPKLCKEEHLADELFRNFEEIINDYLFKGEMNDLEESEFNEDFVNGLGVFDEKKKKKTKKKKKKRGKK